MLEKRLCATYSIQSMIMTVPTTYQWSLNAWRNADSPSMKRRIPTVNTESQQQENYVCRNTETNAGQLGVALPAQAAKTMNIGTMDRTPLPWLEIQNPFLMTICQSTSESSVAANQSYIKKQ